MKALLFAAGLGTRLKPFTLNNPKALTPINNISLLERNIKYLHQYGINEIIINVHHFADKIKTFLKQNNNFGLQIHISDETNQILETGGGLVHAQHYFSTDFLVMNVDILTTLNLTNFISHHKLNNPLVSLAVTDRQSTRKLLFDKNNRLTGWKNLTTKEENKLPNTTYNPLSFSGIHIINPEIFTLMPQKGKFSIIKTYLEIMEKQKIIGFNHSKDILIDVGKPESIPIAEKYFL